MCYFTNQQLIKKGKTIQQHVNYIQVKDRNYER